MSIPPPISCPLCGTVIAATWCHACRVDVIPVSVG
ncbi:DNA-directed RNA polymerase subunit N (RpoN/RPB10) [Microbacterium sp. 1154]|nr:DNA-directed RNA polymerase subunit N (RpoN/RPB10) [Microbacterium sp. 1154]